MSAESPKPPPPPPPPRVEGLPSRNVLLAAAAAGLLFVAMLTCGGGVALVVVLSGSGTGAPPGVKRGVTVHFITTNNNPMDYGHGVVEEVHGQWVLMHDRDKPDRVVWVNFINVVWYRIVK